MGRPSILPELVEKLEQRLEQIVNQWHEQTASSRVPTLPLINGKVNVRELSRQCGLAPSQEQHLFKKPELRCLVDAVAVEQGVETIGSNIEGDGGDAVVKRLRRAQEDRSELSKTLAEREAQLERFRRENEGLREQVALLERTGMVIRLGEVH